MIEFVTTKLVRENIAGYGAVNCPDDVRDFAAEYLKDRDREVFLIACLSSSNEVLCLSKISEGGMDCSIVDPRIVFKTAIMAGAAGIICIHNHPSGNIHPSNEDKAITERLAKCGELLGVKVLDHLIVGHGPCAYSFNEGGLL